VQISAVTNSGTRELVNLVAQTLDEIKQTEIDLEPPIDSDEEDK
jgi:hypothetical protein